MRFLKAAIATMALVGSLVGVSARKHSNPLFSEKAPSDLVLQDMFTAFMKQYSKTYTHDEFSSRFETFKNNMEIIRQHNTQANATFTMGINEFADLTFDEFKAKYFGYKHRESEFIRSKNYHVISEEAAPTAIDWRTSNAVTGVKDQGQCGSCWAFSATGSIEGANVIQGKNALVSLSEQQLVDCSTSFGNNGCNGGLMDYAFEYVIKNGICSEASYGYKGVDGTCKTTCEAVAHISGYSDIPQGNEASLLNAVGTVGPVSVAIEADQQAFQFYSGGVFSASCGTNLDHGVLAVGYGTDGGQDYWLVKNSWGASWGESGYIRMIRNKNQCGIALSASYPKV